MSRKAFLIWGLAIIQLAVMAVAVIMFLALSKLIHLKMMGLAIPFGQILLPVIAVGTLLHLRFKTIGRRHRTLVLCVPIYIVFTLLGGVLAYGYVNSDVFGASDRFYSAIKDWAAMAEPKPETPWNAMQILDYVLFFLPMFYLQSLGLFALLWFGSLDPRTPSKNGFIRFMKHGFERKSGSVAQARISGLAHT